MKTITKVLALTLAAMLLLCGCAAKPESFTANGMSIVLTDDFEKSAQEGFEVVYASKNAAVLVLTEAYGTGLDAALLSAKDYAELFMAVSGKGDVEVKTDKTDAGADMAYCTYTSVVDGASYTYLATVHKNATAFWVIQFSAPTADYEKQAADFTAYAKSVTFDSPYVVSVTP